MSTQKHPATGRYASQKQIEAHHAKRNQAYVAVRTAEGRFQKRPKLRGSR